MSRIDYRVEMVKGEEGGREGETREGRREAGTKGGREREVGYSFMEYTGIDF